jgi:GNAT superfamily N-acetyltransferase
MTAPVGHLTEHDTGVRARRAAGRDLPSIVEVLTAAFLDDPLMTWAVPSRTRRAEILRKIFEITGDVYHPYDEIYVAEPAPVAAAIWIPAGCQPAGEQAEQLVAWYLEAAEEAADRFATALELMDERHPQEAHDYLFLLGTRPEWQSRGFGSVLLGEVLARCDREGRPAYLEATSIGNQRLYLRHGFKVTGEIVLPDGPSMWCMWRDPAPTGTA